MYDEKKGINLDLNNYNYYDLDKLFQCFNDFIENNLKEFEDKKIYMMNLFIKTCMVIFIFFSDDLIIFAPILEPDNYKLYKNLYKFFFKLINILFLLLKKYHKGLIALSACIEGEIPKAILKNDLPRAVELVKEYVEIFGRKNFFLELQNHGLEEEKIEFVCDKIEEFYKNM